MANRASGPAAGANRRVFSRLAILWERLWQALWTPLAVAGLFLASAFFDILPVLPGWLHAGLLAAAAVAVAYALWRGFSGVRLPSAREARRRLEQVNGLADRPLETLEDRLAGEHPDRASAAIWQIHQRRVAQKMGRLRVGWPTPQLVRRDRHGLRIAVGAIALVAFVAAGADSWPRLQRALAPNLGHAGGAAHAAKLDAWITPPEHTGRPPLFLTGGEAATGAVSVPAGSTLLAQVTGGSGVPRLRLDDEPIEFESVSESSFQIRRQLDTSGAAEVVADGRTLGKWPIEVVKDLAPVIAFAGDPGPTEHHALQIPFTASDDYGLVAARATVSRPGAAEPLTLSLPLPAEGTDGATAFHDLTPHPWAGLEVTVVLEATDAIGQTGRSEERLVTLPERPFNHPVAQAIVAERKRLAADPEGNRQAVVDALGLIAWETEAYGDDVVVFMSLNTAARRLLYDRTERRLDDVLQLLWDTALRVEDGQVSIAMRSLREAQKALQDALARNAPDAEIARLMEELQRALDAYLDALAEMMRNQPQDAQPMPLDPSAQVLDRADLQRMMDQIREMARSGAREAAQQMLSDLQRTLENMRAGIMQPPQGAGQAGQMMNDLDRLRQAQQDLLDRTFRESQPQSGMPGDGQQRGQGQRGQDQPGQGQQPGSPQAGDRLGAGAVVQEALRRQLGDLMQRYAEMTGDVPGAFGRAEQAMRESSQALRGGDAAGAIDPQSRALDQLQQALDAAQQQMQQQFGGRPGQGSQPGRQPGGSAQGEERDPFGRSTNNGRNGASTTDVEIPGEGELQRAREVQEELRRRAGERGRPPRELDYIERLLERF